MRHLGTTRTRLEGEPFSLKVFIAQFGKIRRRCRLTLIVGVNVAPQAFVIRPGWGAKATVGQSLFACPCDGACVDTMAPPLVSLRQAGPILSSAWHWRQPVRKLAAIRASELELVRYGPHVLRDENLQLPACSPRVGDGSGSRCSCGVSFSAPAVSWGPPPIAGVYSVGARRR